MSTTYTDNFALPLLEDGSENWGAVFNAAMEIMDREVKAAQTPIILMSTGQILVSKRLGTVLLKHFQGN